MYLPLTCALSSPKVRKFRFSSKKMNNKSKVTRIILPCFAIIVLIAAAVFWFGSVSAIDHSGVKVTRSAVGYQIEADDLGLIRKTTQPVSSLERISVADSNSTVFTWKEDPSDGKQQTFYSVSVDGKSVSQPIQARYDIMLRYSVFDPLVSTPAIPEALSGNDDGRKGVYIVQFKTQAIDGYTRSIESLGGKVFMYVPEYAYIVQMDNAAKAKIENLPFVRWVGNYEPAYKIDPDLIESSLSGSKKLVRYNIMMLERGSNMQDSTGSLIEQIGGKVHTKIPEGYRIEATLDSEQLTKVAHSNDVLFIDLWSKPENDMDIVRNVGGANFIESTLGFRGEGVRSEVMDNELRRTHNDFQSGLTPLLHTAISSDGNHGTSTYGINFGRGTSSSAARGMLPEAQGIFADYDAVDNRYTHTAQLNQSPYYAVYQSNSWGSNRTYFYTTLSAEMDDILFLNDVLILQSQSNAGDQDSRPQAWAKNIVSIGGIYHNNTATFTDDRWNHGASVGPASDGRIKPELAHFYDSVYTTNNSGNSSYYQFGGTSAATPIVAGHFGIFYQMWHAGLFGNQTSTSVFNSRPHMTTAKAIMINTAVQWDMNISGTDTTRVRQGFGRPDLKNLYDLRNKMRIINETDVLTNLQSKIYTVYVPQGSTDPMKVTMVYNDPMGNPAASRTRINDLSLKVTDPSGNIFWGNNGLGVGGGMWSASGGSANIVDTVENVFILSPMAGAWTIEVIASELNQDARSETPGVIDADFALVASGISPVSPTAASVLISGQIMTSNGSGISGAVIRAIDDDGIIKTARTGTFGYYLIEGLQAGRSYIVTVDHPRYTFDPASVVRSVDENITDLNFVTIPEDQLRR